MNVDSTFLQQFSVNTTLIFVIVLVRMGSLVTFAPFWSLEAISMRIRIILAFTVTIVIVPVVASRIGVLPTDLASLSIIIAGELLIGCALGFVGRLVFNSIEIAAHVLTSQIGFSLAAIIDPTSRAQSTAIGTFAQMIATTIFLAMNGHHWFLMASVDSFQFAGPGTITISAALATTFLRLSANALTMGIAIAAPAVIMMLVIEFMIGIIGKVLPQIQVLLLSFPVKIAAGLWLVGTTLYFLPNLFRNTLSLMRIMLWQILKMMQ